MIELKCLNARDLEAFVGSAEYATMEHLPISQHRAQSHIRNPRAREDDVLLILAYEGAQMVGYLGIFPDRIHFRAGGPEHCGWLSCIWVDLRFRGKGISKSLVRKALELYDNQILVTEFTEPAKRLYDKTGAFISLADRQGFRLYHRLDLRKILVRKGGILARLGRFLGVIDFLGNAVLDLRFLFAGRSLTDFQYEYVGQVDSEIQDFVKMRQGGQLFRRGQAELQWMIENPWVLPGDPKSRVAQRYAFSSFDHSFDFVQLKVRDGEGKLSAYMMFTKRHGNLKVNYLYHDDLEDAMLLKILHHHLVKWKIKTAIVYQEELVRAIRKGKTGSLHKKQAARNYIIGKVFADDLKGNKFEIQDGDGDCGFT